MVPPLGLEPRTSGSTNLRLLNDYNGLIVNQRRKNLYKTTMHGDKCKLNPPSIPILVNTSLRRQRSQVRILSSAPKNSTYSTPYRYSGAAPCKRL